jgi:6-pyruvoyltetrahydropterin/6-carboxytetrahydropterin synthase
MFYSKKLIDGFSTCFRQHTAEDTHCKFLHGYAISFNVIFIGELDSRNWVVDFGGLKRAKCLIDDMSPKAWFDHFFDHTVVLAEDDKFLWLFKGLNEAGALQLRTLPAVGMEMFAKFVYDKLSVWVEEEFQGRVKVLSVECREHEKNSAIYRKS